MADYISIDEARSTSGLRIVLPPGRANPWGEALKGFCHLKGLPFVRVRKAWGHDEELRQWTAQSSAPVVVYNDERPRSLWIDQLYLLERLGPKPALIPQDLPDRIRMFGMANLLCGEEGFTWQRRLMLIEADLTKPDADTETVAFAGYMADKYGHSAAAAAAAPGKAAAILRAFADQLADQQARGRRYLIGTTLTALDIYWATFAVLIDPLPAALCPIPEALRAYYRLRDPEALAAITPELMAHRDFVYATHLPTPLDL